jgi:hypothetical protein
MEKGETRADLEEMQEKGLEAETSRPCSGVLNLGSNLEPPRALKQIAPAFYSQTFFLISSTV